MVKFLFTYVMCTESILLTMEPIAITVLGCFLLLLGGGGGGGRRKQRPNLLLPLNTRLKLQRTAFLKMFIFCKSLSHELTKKCKLFSSSLLNVKLCW